MTDNYNGIDLDAINRAAHKHIEYDAERANKIMNASIFEVQSKEYQTDMPKRDDEPFYYILKKCMLVENGFGSYDPVDQALLNEFLYRSMVGDLDS